MLLLATLDYNEAAVYVQYPRNVLRSVHSTIFQPWGLNTSPRNSSIVRANPISLSLGGVPTCR